MQNLTSDPRRRLYNKNSMEWNACKKSWFAARGHWLRAEIEFWHAARPWTSGPSSLKLPASSRPLVLVKCLAIVNKMAFQGFVNMIMPRAATTIICAHRCTWPSIITVVILFRANFDRFLEMDAALRVLPDQMLFASCVVQDRWIMLVDILGT